MRVCFYHTKQLGRTKEDAARAAARIARATWINANFAVINENSVVSRIMKLYNEFDALRKCSSRKEAPGFQSKLKVYKESLEAEFDIVRCGPFPTPSPKIKREATSLAQKGRLPVVRRRTLFCDGPLQAEDEDEVLSEEAEDDKDEDWTMEGFDEEAHPELLEGPVAADELLLALDRSQVSSRNAFRSVSMAARFFRLDLKSVRISRSTLQRKREKVRNAVWMGIREAFQPSVPLTVHADGIKVRDLKGREKVERLPVIVTGKGVDQILGGNKIQSGTGAAQSAQILANLTDWGCTDRVRAICTDTTSSNTGHNIGAVVKLEALLGRKLLYLACRHHALEVIPKHLFQELVQESKSPDLGALCARFEKEWPQMDDTKFSAGTEDDELHRILTPETVERILQFAMSKLESKQVRADYQYFLELAVLFVGGSLKNFHFRPPMALSSARFMGRVIYCLSMYMFSRGGQFPLEDEILRGIREVNVFAVTIYLEPWFTATDPVKAPLNDLMLLKNMIDYLPVSPVTANCALTAFQEHLWYLSEECVALAFFDERVTVETKRAMVLNLSIQRKQNAKQKMRFVVERHDGVYDLADKDLDFFCYLDIDTAFLLSDPSTWHLEKSFKDGLETAKALQVVNDVAERGVALVKSFTACGNVTNNEAEFQKLLVVCRKLMMEETSRDLTVNGVIERIKSQIK
ncbi:Protein CROWDED NUCLEI 1 [Frankliniella fusca]|uniref:Protein CROWDED NUCLEI 1 n=1 Tax=Frankliniella fusca TaxID=407009 RepID=A0AAE1GWC2_9NEOP|nr:Protein CROWDED NUCLEI 1 [Frankliniella fusca]